MVILYEIGTDRKATQLVADPFEDEVNDMEPFIIENLSLLSENEEYFLLKKESTHGKTGKRQDILALDENGRLIIIELKKDSADIEFESQIRDYWRTMRNNPDTVKKYWLEAKDDLNGIQYDSSKDPKIIVVASDISDEWVQSTHDELNLDIDFIEVKRFKKGSQTYISVNDKAPKQIKKPRESTSREDYNWEHYSDDMHWDNEDIQVLQNLEKEILQFAKKEGMDLHMEFKKNYIPFKHGPRSIVLSLSVQNKKIYITLTRKIKDKDTKIDGTLLDGMEPGWYIDRKKFELEFDRKSVPKFSMLEKPINLAYAMT